MKIPVVSVLWRYVKLFYAYTGVKFFYFVVIIVTTGFVESLGISVAMPLINIVVSGAGGKDIDKFSQIFEKICHSINVTPSLSVVIVIMISLFLFKSIFLFVQSVYQANIIANLFKDVRTELLEKCCDIKYRYFLNVKIGHLNNVLSVEANRFASGFKHLCQFFAASINGIIYLSFAVLINLEFSLIVGGVGVFIYVAFLKLRKSVSLLSREYTNLNKESQSWSIQFLNNYKYLKATSQLDKIKIKLNTIFETTKSVSISSEKINAFTRIATQFLSSGVVLGCFYYFIEIEGQSFAEVIVPLLFINRTFANFSTLQDKWQGFLTMSGSIWDIVKTQLALNENIERENGSGINDFNNEIEFKDVSLLYGKKVILQNVSFSIKKNTSIGIVGRSGSGKTTLLDLLTGLITPTSGKIKIDGVDYHSIDKKKLRNLFGYITQEPVMFNDTIYNNITLWDSNQLKDAEMERVKCAVYSGHVAEFIKDAGKGFDEIIGDKGVRLSGGQKQRIGISREIYRDKDILVLDEATASLDSESEVLIQSSIQNLSSQKTMIIVAHRLSTLRFCDIIIVLDNGEIIESGSWDGLMRNPKSRLLHMVNAQKGTM